MFDHRITIALFVASVSTGCVTPDASQPWSTKAQSRPAAAKDSRGETATMETITIDAAAIEPWGDLESKPALEPVSDEVVVVEEDVRRDRIVDDAGTAEVSVVESDGAVGAAVVEASPSGQSLRDSTIAWLEQAADHELPLVRGYSFEAMERAPALLSRLAPAGFIDENRGVRFIATMAVGQAGIEGLVPLLEPGQLDRSESVKAATIYALRALGQATDPTPLAAMAGSDDPEVRANAIMILGMLGNPSAIPLIKSTLGAGMLLANPMRVRVTELQAAESLVLLGDEGDIEPIRAALFAPVEQGEITVLACDMLGRLGDEQARPMLMRLIVADGNQRRPPEIRVAAAGALLRLSPPRDPALGGVLIEASQNADARLRVQAAGALAHLSAPAGLEALTRLLADEDPLVKTAAAGAILAQLAGKAAVVNTTGD